MKKKVSNHKRLYTEKCVQIRWITGHAFQNGGPSAELTKEKEYVRIMQDTSNNGQEVEICLQSRESHGK